MINVYRAELMSQRGAWSARLAKMIHPMRSARQGNVR